MRLFEVALGSARSVLSVLKGQVGADGTSTIPFQAVMNMIQPFNLGVSSPKGLSELITMLDPEGNIVSDVSDTGDLTLNSLTQNVGDQQPDAAGAGSTVDQMASSNSKNLSPNL